MGEKKIQPVVDNGPKLLTKIRKGAKISGAGSIMGFTAKGRQWAGWVNQIVADAIGGKWDNGNNTRFPSGADALLYLMRRYGMPVHYCDEHKEAAKYILTTPMAGLYLTVSIKAYDCDFGYMATEKISNALNKSEWEGRSAWHKRCQAWVKETYGEYLIGVKMFGWYSCRITKMNEKEDKAYYHKKDFSRLIALYNRWCKYNDKPQLSPEEENKRFKTEFSEYQERVIEYYQLMYEYVEPRKKYSPNAPIVNEVVEALSAAAADLLRLIYVRDCQFNIRGKLRKGDFEKLKEKFGEDGMYAEHHLINKQITTLRKAL